MAEKRELSPLAELLGALRAEKIQYQLIGMSAAVLQGVLAATFDVDLWINLKSRQYMRPIRVALKLGAQMVRNTIVELRDATLVNFIFAVDGLGNYQTEAKKARTMKFHGLRVPVMPLKSILKSKLAIRRPKDEPHIFYINQAMRVKKANEGRI